MTKTTTPKRRFQGERRCIFNPCSFLPRVIRRNKVYGHGMAEEVKLCGRPAYANPKGPGFLWPVSCRDSVVGTTSPRYGSLASTPSHLRTAPRPGDAPGRQSLLALMADCTDRQKVTFSDLSMRARRVSRGYARRSWGLSRHGLVAW